MSNLVFGGDIRTHAQSQCMSVLRDAVNQYLKNMADYERRKKNFRGDQRAYRKLMLAYKKRGEDFSRPPVRPPIKPEKPKPYYVCHGLRLCFRDDLSGGVWISLCGCFVVAPGSCYSLNISGCEDLVFDVRVEKDPRTATIENPLQVRIMESVLAFNAKNRNVPMFWAPDKKALGDLISSQSNQKKRKTVLVG
jgi:hypothetical protein